MIEVSLAKFKNIPNMPEVHKDERRTIYELIETDKNGTMDRKTKIVISADSAILGNHYHDFDEYFSGDSKGTLYTASKNDERKIDTQELPDGGWELVIPAGTIHAFRYSKGSVVISRASAQFVEGTNTHTVVIAK